MGPTSPCVLLFLSALLISGNTQALPTATVDITFPLPPPHYTKNRVILRCDISEYDDWSYIWSINGQDYRGCFSKTCVFILGSDNTLGLNTVKYSCRGTRSGQPQFSQQSPDISVQVTALPTATVNILSPPAPHYPGDTVTLQCDISQYEDWNYYYWVINDREYRGCISETCTIKLVDHGFRHSCEGLRSGQPQNSQTSPISTTFLTALPTATLTVTPNPVYHGETVSLKCSVDSGPAWSYRWFNNRAEITEDRSGRHRISGDTLTITKVEPSDQGRYQCRGEIPSRTISSVFSDSISITVKAGPVTLESPVHPVSEGDSVTLRCRQEPPPSKPKVDFYKDGHLIRKETTGEMTIPAVSLSDEGLYKCSYSDRGESPQSWLLVRGIVVPVQSVTLVSKLLYGLLGTAVFLVITILLFLLIKRLPSVKTAKENEGAELTVRSPRDRSLGNTEL